MTVDPTSPACASSRRVAWRERLLLGVREPLHSENTQAPNALIHLTAQQNSPGTPHVRRGRANARAPARARVPSPPRHPRRGIEVARSSQVSATGLRREGLSKSNAVHRRLQHPTEIAHLHAAADVWDARGRTHVEGWQRTALGNLLPASATDRARVGEPDVTLWHTVAAALAEDRPGALGCAHTTL